MASIVKRLTQQLRDKGQENPDRMAVALLTKYGELKDGKLTAKGKQREALCAAGRAKDRAAKDSAHKPSEYAYNAKTNRATLKDRK